MANSIRALAMDAVQQANSGHPGMPMGMADVATVLFTQFLKFDPTHAEWPDRDRFVLSAGHGSMLLYALLYLTGYSDWDIEDLKQFRQLNSKCAGHPEYGYAPGIETTTGPLGQGLSNAVGMALAERMMAARYGKELVDHHTYIIAGDGCLMEGISHEAASLAGHLCLHKLIVLWDDNSISIDGSTDLAVSDDTHTRFKAYGWNTFAIDGHDPSAIADALEKAKKSDKPVLIACKTTIGYGAPNKQGTAATHGAPLGEEEIAATRTLLDWHYAPFEIPEEILSAWRETGTRGADAYNGWTNRLNDADKEVRTQFERILSHELPDGWAKAFNHFKQELAEKKPKEATRKSSQNALEILTSHIPELIGGSADLTGSNNTKTKVQPPVTASDFSGRYLHWGVREHAMASCMNGMALHGGFIPYGGTFLVFTDYCRPAIRLSALMHQQVIYVMTHDSIGLGEDGPTHQPIEHLASLRAMPNTYVFRPADAIETAECWAMALAIKDAPSILSLSRQGLPALRTTHIEENLCARGGYVLSPSTIEGKDWTNNCGLERDIVLIATGSEVQLAITAQKQLAEHNISSRVVSLPCWELFEEQSFEYQDEVLGENHLRIAIEAGSSFGWERWLGDYGEVIAMESFGASAPASALYQHFDITAEAIVNTAQLFIDGVNT